MMRKVADTPGPFAMVGRKIFAEKFIYQNERRRVKDGKTKDSHSTEGV
jgi:hypothetical protein